MSSLAHFIISISHFTLCRSINNAPGKKRERESEVGFASKKLDSCTSHHSLGIIGFTRSKATQNGENFPSIRSSSEDRKLNPE